jgi:two-component system, NtrC family, response regulator AtoC
MDILIVDDEKKMVSLLGSILRDEGHQVTGAGGGGEAIAELKKGNFDLVLTDLRMSPIDGMEVLRAVKRLAPDCEVVMMTAYASAETAIEAMKLGAFDYLLKPFKTEELLILVKRIAERRSLQDENKALRQSLGDRFQFDNIISQSGPMQEVLQQAVQVAPTATTVLLRGESGTGKELIARVIHQSSPRCNKPLVRVNSSALPDTLLESELFGHEKGAFTGAYATHKGKFESAADGSIFLDEIGDISPRMQAKLLRVLQEKEFDRVGGKTTLSTDARVIAATNRDLEQLMESREFREDLYYRLSVFPIFIPPLRQRREDIAPLVEFFFRKYNRPGATISAEALELFQAYRWPGNVRELENVIERASIVMQGNELRVDNLPPQMQQQQKQMISTVDLMLPDEGIDFDELQKSVIVKALEKAGGNKTKAAKLLNMSRRKLYSRMESLGLSLEG